MWGWRSNVDSNLTTLMVVYTDSELPEPGWSPMPLADTDRTEWSPFVWREYLPAAEFWGDVTAGSIVDVGNNIIGRFPGTIFWVPTTIPGAGAGCIAVKAEVVSPTGFTLPRGRYVFHEALQTNPSIPSLAEMLGTPGRIDLSTHQF